MTDPHFNEVRLMWSDVQTEYLIDQRISRNREFWGLSLQLQIRFWRSVSNNINECFLTSFTAEQVRRKWNNITHEYRVSTFMLIIKLLLYFINILIF